MSREKRRLGQGLAALLGAPLRDDGPDESPQDDHDLRVHPDTVDGDDVAASEDANRPATSRSNSDVGDLLNLNVDEIDDNPFQPRRDFSESEIGSLSESLKEHDMLQPVLVRRLGDRYQLISGERRLRAAIQAGWATVPARLREADDRLVAELAIVENLQRKDLNPIEKALSFRRYLDEHGCPQEDLAKRLKIDRSTIANLLRLLELPDGVQDTLRSGNLSAGHARALLPLGDEWQQIEFGNKIVEEGLSVRETERLVNEKILEEDGHELSVIDDNGQKTKRTRSEQVASLEQEFRSALGTKIDIRHSNRGRGRIVIHFSNHEEFERLRATIVGHGNHPQADAG